MNFLKLFRKKLSKKSYFIFYFLILFDFITSLIDYLVPKNCNIIIFGSNSGEFISGCPKMIYKYIKKKNLYKVYYYLPFKENNFINIIKYIINFIPIFLRAKFLISSHPPSDFFPFFWSSKKVFINTWHGTPIKAIFFSDKGQGKIELVRMLQVNKKTTVFLVSSMLEAKVMQKCFMIDYKKFYFLGHPRNDKLYRTNNYFRKIPKIIKNIPEYNKIILYAPTYRRDTEVSLFPFPDFDLEHFKLFLDRHKILLLLRVHQYSNSKLNLFSERIINFGFDICSDIYQILPEVDILITDYSSIYIDFLLLERPCIFIPYDYKRYEENRGFNFNYYLIIAGDCVMTYKDLINSIEKILIYGNTYKNKMKKLKKIFHYYQKNNSCEKIFQIINKFNNINNIKN